MKTQLPFRLSLRAWAKIACALLAATIVLSGCSSAADEGIDEDIDKSDSGLPVEPMVSEGERNAGDSEQDATLDEVTKESLLETINNAKSISDMFVRTYSNMDKPSENYDEAILKKYEDRSASLGELLKRVSKIDDADTNPLESGYKDYLAIIEG